jgi:hypothetical protein
LEAKIKSLVSSIVRSFLMKKFVDGVIKSKSRKKIRIKKIAQWLVRVVKPTIAIIAIFLSFFPFRNTQINKKSSQVLGTNTAQAHYQYTAASGQINSSRGTQRYNDYYSTRAADTSTWTVSPIDITSPDTSLDMEVTVDGVDLQGANKMILTFRTSVSNTSLHYVFSVWDKEDSIWRPLNNHTAFDPSSPTDLTNFYSQELVPAAVSTSYVYQFEIFDGYFADTTSAPGSAITTQLDDFVDSSGNVKLRVSSDDDPGTATWFMNWDFAQIEVGIDPGYAPSAVNKTTGGSWSRYYSDVFTSDNAAAGTSNTNSLAMPSSGNAVNIDFTFSGIEPPYAGANTLLLWLEDATSVANLSGDVKVYFWNYTSSAWEGTAVSSGDASSTTLNQNLIWMFSTPLTDHISLSGDTREAKVKIEASHSASFTLYVDWMKLVVGSTNDGTQQSNISVGSTSSGSVSDTANVDSTAASPSVWTIASSNTYTNQFSGDTASTYSVAVDHSAPVTKPSGSAITGIQRASRVSNSSATPVTPIGIRDYAGGWSDFQTRTAAASYQQQPYLMSGNMYRYAVWGSFGSASAAATAVDTAFGQNPEDSLDTTNNLIGMKIRTSTGLTSSFNVLLDFAFVSIRYVETGAVFETQFTPEDGTKNVGGAETNSWRFTKQADSTATPWTIANSGAGDGVDVQLEFRNVTLPSTYNRLILNTKYAWSVANSTHNIQIYDWNGGVWRPLGGHAQATTNYQLNSSGTAAAYQFYQFEIYNGYFRDATGAPGAAINTPVSYFVGTGGDAGKVRIKYVRGTTTSNLSIDWAQIEIAQDNAYYMTSATHNVGSSPARFYNDTHYPDNTVASGTGVHNYSMAITKAGSSPYLNTYLDFANVDTPYAGANAILIDYSAATSVLNEPVTLQIWNTNTSDWDPLNTGNLQGGTANRYERWQFIQAVSNWGYYIDAANNNRVRLRVYTTDSTALTYYLDYVRITLGSVTTSGQVGDVNWGTSFLNDKLATTTLDSTLLPSFTANTENGWYVNSDPSSGNGKATDSPSSVSAYMSFPVTRPSNSLITGVRWAIRAQTGATTLTVQAQTRDRSSNYSALTNAQYLTWSGAAAASNNLGYAPTAADGITIASASQVLISGLYQTNPSDVINTTDDRVRLALRTTASTTLIEQSLIWDMAFVSVRYVTP